MNSEPTPLAILKARQRAESITTRQRIVKDQKVVHDAKREAKLLELLKQPHHKTTRKIHHK